MSDDDLNASARTELVRALTGYAMANANAISERLSHMADPRTVDDTHARRNSIADFCGRIDMAMVMITRTVAGLNPWDMAEAAPADDDESEAPRAI